MDSEWFDVEEAIGETIDFLTVRRAGEQWVGEMPDWFDGYVFGGLVLAQAVYAATRVAPQGRRVHSVHGYFLRPVSAGRPVSYRIDPLRDGRTFASRRLEMTQDGEGVFTMACSFTADTEGYEYELPMTADVPDAVELDVVPGPPPWHAAYLGPTDREVDGTRRSTHRAWIRVADQLPDDPHLHAALVAFATDWTGTGGRPLHLDGDTTGMVSLDHAVWFHRPARADDWLFYDVHALVNAGGRGLLRGTMYGSDRRIVASAAQEMLLRPVEG